MRRASSQHMGRRLRAPGCPVRRVPVPILDRRSPDYSFHFADPSAAPSPAGAKVRARSSRPQPAKMPGSPGRVTAGIREVPGGDPVTSLRAQTAPAPSASQRGCLTRRRAACDRQAQPRHLTFSASKGIYRGGPEPTCRCTLRHRCRPRVNTGAKWRPPSSAGVGRHLPPANGDTLRRSRQAQQKQRRLRGSRQRFSSASGAIVKYRRPRRRKT